MEKELQTFVESNLPVLLGMRLVASEYRIGAQLGRIDTLALDDANSPVIIEFKRDSAPENVMSQGLFYLDWLKDHRDEFARLAAERLHIDPAVIDWSGVRVVCIAQDFNRYDFQAINHFNANLDLMSYQFFTDSLFCLQHQASTRRPDYLKESLQRAQRARLGRGFAYRLSSAGPAVKALVAALRSKLEELADVVITEGPDDCQFGAPEMFGRFWVTAGVHPRLKVSLALEQQDRNAVAGVARADGSVQFSIRTPDDLTALTPELEAAYHRALRSQ